MTSIPAAAQDLRALYPPFATPGITDDERRTIAEMMAKGTYAVILLPPPTSTAPSRASRPAAPRSSRSRPTSRTAFATAPSAIPAGNLMRIQELR